MKLSKSVFVKIPLKFPSKSWLKLLGYGFLIYFFALLLNFPAHIAWQFIPKSSLQSVRTQTLEGTIWTGKISGLNISGMDLGQLTWNLNPLSLLFGQLEMDARLNGSNKELQGQFIFDTDGSIHAQSVNGTLQATELSPFTLPVSLQGALILKIKTLQFQPGKKLSIEGELRWNDASIDMVQTVELGKLHALIQPTPTGIVLKVKNSDSALAVDGTINLDMNGLYQTNLGLFNRDPKRQDITMIVEMIGQPNATGRVYLRQRGKVPL